METRVKSNAYCTTDLIIQFNLVFIADKTTPVMIIGNNNVFEVDCLSNALKIGDNNVLESKSSVGRSTELTSGCIVGAGCELNAEEVSRHFNLYFCEISQY